MGYDLRVSEEGFGDPQDDLFDAKREREGVGEPVDDDSRLLVEDGGERGVVLGDCECERAKRDRWWDGDRKVADRSEKGRLLLLAFVPQRLGGGEHTRGDGPGG
jgi:hypothetical protein